MENELFQLCWYIACYVVPLALLILARFFIVLDRSKVSNINDWVFTTIGIIGGMLVSPWCFYGSGIELRSHPPVAYAGNVASCILWVAVACPIIGVMASHALRFFCAWFILMGKK